MNQFADMGAQRMSPQNGLANLDHINSGGAMAQAIQQNCSNPVGYNIHHQALPQAQQAAFGQSGPPLTYTNQPSPLLRSH